LQIKGGANEVSMKFGSFVHEIERFNKVFNAFNTIALLSREKMRGT